MSEPAEIATKLTKAQREAVTNRLQGYFDPNTVRSLRRKGLTEGGLLLTPLGLAVRRHLLETTHAD